MIRPGQLQDRAHRPSGGAPPTLTDREREVLTIITAYVSVAHESPSAGWLSRRLQIHRSRAHQLMQSVRDKMDRGARP